MLGAIVRKELLLVRRDIHALMVLFVMPMAFILIMSLSLQETLGDEEVNRPRIGWVAADGNAAWPFAGLPGFERVDFPDRQALFAAMAHDDLLAGLVLQGRSEGLAIHYAATTPKPLRRLLRMTVIQTLMAARLGVDATADPDALPLPLPVTEHEAAGDAAPQPSAVQQSVPAWLIFSMFFVVIPIATTFLQERQQGTLQRLRSLPVPANAFLLGKLVPYLLINQVQAVLMFVVGIWLVPAVGGEGLQLPARGGWWLVPVTLAVSLAAISFALLVATVVRTTEQATTVGGISNLLLGALGGIMVPTYVMPAAMRDVARLSPMNWGLEAYLDILLRGAEWQSILPAVGKLLLLALGLFLLAGYRYRNATRFN